MANEIPILAESDLIADGGKIGAWWHPTDQAGRLVCDLCPRACHLKPGTRGFCFVRENRDGRMVLTTYGRSTGFCVDPIEKKPLHHFLPGSSVLSFGTAGCNLGCKFCQNWSISKSREVALLSETATPDAIAQAALRLGCRSVAFTYNDPVIWAEYAIDVAKACHHLGIKTVAVTAGYITATARQPFFDVMDAANVDLKAFTEQFYQHMTLSHLQPVLETLQWLHTDSAVWFEITNLVIPQANDTPDELRRMCDWILAHLGDEIPVHFTAFHPDFRLRDRGRTPLQTLLAAYDIACQAGLRYVYVGNVHALAQQSTYCPHCQQTVIERDWYQLGRYHLQGNRCQHCGGRIAGCFDTAPGNWGRKRLPVPMAQFAAPSSVTPETDRKIIMTSVPPSVTNIPVQVANALPQNTSGPPILTPQQERLIHYAASAIIAAAVLRRSARLADTTLGGAAEKMVMGAFVSLKRRSQLRGCCGFFGQATPLVQALSQAAIRTATEDVRLPPISPTELPYLDLEVWLLHSPQPVTAQGEHRLAAVTIGQHGLYIRRGKASGLLLPGVAVEHQLDARAFLEQVCHKANLPPTAWKEGDTQLTTFAGQAIIGPFDQRLAEASAAALPPLLTIAEVVQLARHCGQNIMALIRGAMASCFSASAPDGTVHGLSISVHLPDNQHAPQFSRLSLRPGLPLQSTLYSLAETAARALSAQRIATQTLAELQVDLTVLWDSAMHGTLQEPDFDGIDAARRALMVIEGPRSAWVYNPQLSPRALLAASAREAQVQHPASARIVSLSARSTAAVALVATVPRPQAGPKVRPPAVAGAFYPSEAAALVKMVAHLCIATAPQRQYWPAVMVPHAGLQYSGKIAAAVFQRIVIPDVVIILGPRHRPIGMEWAVAPHDTWALPGITVASDPALAQQLAAAIPDLHLDALAHQREHSIEVQLPLLAQLAPHTRVVGMTLGAGDLDRCRQLAAGLAAVLQEQSHKPLLIISTDLHHYASDPENRRLDEMLLTALERLDPADVYATVQQHRISMCGLLPTVVVLETLRQLGTLHTCQRVAYATSADAGGDRQRVVGYAGMLFG